MAGDSRARILQKPRIQTSHNEPAQLFVGESRPYPSASYYGGGAFGGYSSIQAVNIGVTLEVTPLINPDGLVVMDIHQTIESANGSVNIANVGDVPITSRQATLQRLFVGKDRDGNAKLVLSDSQARPRLTLSVGRELVPALAAASV